MPARRQTLPQPMFHPIYARIFCNLARARGVDVDALLEAAGLTERQLGSDAHGIGLAKMGIMVREASRRSGDPLLAFEWGLASGGSVHGIHGIAVSSSRDVREGLETLAEMINLRGQIFLMRLGEKTPGDCCFGVATAVPLGDLRDFLFATVSVLIVQLIVAMVGPEATDMRLEMPLAEPAWSDGGTRYYPCPVRFDAPALQLWIPSRLLDRPCLAADVHARQAALRQCRFDAQSPTGTLSSRIAGYLALQEDRYPDLPGVARYLGVSQRGLSRTLQKEGSSFQGLLDDARKVQAQQYLSDPAWTVERIGARLGYSDTSNFIRAFRRWHGCSPQQFRIRAGSAALAATKR